MKIKFTIDAAASAAAAAAAATDATATAAPETLLHTVAQRILHSAQDEYFHRLFSDVSVSTNTADMTVCLSTSTEYYYKKDKDLFDDFCESLDFDCHIIRIDGVNLHDYDWVSECYECSRDLADDINTCTRCGEDFCNDCYGYTNCSNCITCCRETGEASEADSEADSDTET